MTVTTASERRLQLAPISWTEPTKTRHNPKSETQIGQSAQVLRVVAVLSLKANFNHLLTYFSHLRGQGLRPWTELPELPQPPNHLSTE